VRDGYKLTALIPEERPLPEDWQSIIKQNPEKLKILNGSIHDLEKISNALRTHKDIIHLAGLISKENILEIGTKHKKFIEKAKEMKISTFIWPRFYLNVNGAAKKTDEYFKIVSQLDTLITRSGFRHRILRCAPILGRNISFFENIVAHLRKNSKIALPEWAQKPLQFLFLNDFRTAILEILKRPGEWGYSINLANPETFTFQELLEKIAERLKKEIKFSKSPKLFNKGLQMGKSVFQITQKIIQKDKEIPDSSDILGKILISNQLIEGLLANWQKIENVESFFSDIFHRPQSLDGMLRNYFSYLF
jgi:hypothetical protein